MMVSMIVVSRKASALLGSHGLRFWKIVAVPVVPVAGQGRHSA